MTKNDDFGAKLFDFGTNAYDFSGKKPENSIELEQEENKSRRRTTECIVRTDKHLYRRAFSETQLMDVAGINFKDGESYHFLTAGDVDSLSYLKLVIRQQDLDYCLFSTWCMAGEDILQFREWLENGKIKKLDAYVGEIFPSSYKYEWISLKELINEFNGRLCVFKNHSKIYAGYGKKFAFGIETSANINTNPRTENGCITISNEIYEFYKTYFDGIKSFV